MFGIFNTCTDVGACDCTQGLYRHHKRVCTEVYPRRKKSLAAPGTLTGVSIRLLCLAFQSDIVPAELSLPQGMLDPNHHVLHKPTQRNRVVRLKACEPVTKGGGT